MVEFEADDAMATDADRWWDAPGVEQVVICSPDKDLTQMVRDDRVVCLDRRRKVILDEAGVRDKFGVWPESIPDYLALVGDAADCIPGIPRWGAKTTAQVLDRYRHIEGIPDDWDDWDVRPKGAQAVAASLAKHRQQALLYKTLTTLRLDVPLPETLAQLCWRGVPRQEYRSMCAEMGFSGLMERPGRWFDG
jgi:5'-3' exonuclease